MMDGLRGCGGRKHHPPPIPRAHPFGASSQAQWILGRALISHGEYEEAETIIHEALPKARNLFGSGNLHTNRFIGGLIVLYEETGRVELADALRHEYAKALAGNMWSVPLSEAIFAMPMGNREIFEILRDIPAMPLERGSLKAEVIERILELRRAVPDDDPRAAVIAMMIGNAFRAMFARVDHPQIARHLFEDSIEVLRNNPYAHEGHVGWSLHRYLFFYANQMRSVGQHETVLELAYEALPILERVYGDLDVNTHNIRTIIGRAYLDMGEYETAERYIQRAYADVLRAHGPAHIGPIRYVETHLDLYREWDRMDVAIAFLEENLPMHIHNPDTTPEHLRELVRIITTHGGFPGFIYEQAMEMARMVYEREPDEPHPYTYAALGRAYFRLGKYQKAIEAFRTYAGDEPMSGVVQGMMAMALVQIAAEDEATAACRGFREAAPFMMQRTPYFVDEVLSTCDPLLED
jgi:tetratricopeptide (TPR) repeat protein